jgi:Caspase domain
MKGLFVVITIVLAASVTVVTASSNSKYMTPSRVPRLALIVGVEKYDNTDDFSTATNAIQDADQVAKLLFGLNFDPIIVPNPSHDDIETGLANLAARLQAIDGPAIVAFFFAGHGTQMDSKTALLPKESRFASIQDNAVFLDQVIESLGGGYGRVALIISDACRTDLKDPLNTQGFLTGEQKSPGTVLVFASQPGHPAIGRQFKDDRASVFTKALSSQLGVTDRALQEILSDVKAEVWVASEHKQFPDVVDGLVGRLILDQAVDEVVQRDIWVKALNTNQRSEVERFLMMNPDSYYATAAYKWLQDNEELLNEK